MARGMYVDIGQHCLRRHMLGWFSPTFRPAKDRQENEKPTRLGPAKNTLDNDHSHMTKRQCGCTIAATVAIRAVGADAIIISITNRRKIQHDP